MSCNRLHWNPGYVWPPSGSEGEKDDSVTEVYQDGGTKTGGWRLFIAHLSPVPSSFISARPDPLSSLPSAVTWAHLEIVCVQPWVGLKLAQVLPSSWRFGFSLTAGALVG